MAIHHRPPVIPEIAKAYQNDPATQLALKAIANGTSSAPVARGGYGMGDGAARVAQALIGAAMDKRTQAKYGDEEDQLLALRKARGVDGITGVAGTGAPAVPAASAPGVRNDDYANQVGNADQPDNYGAIAT